jgi:hypothetical protein
MRVYTLYLSTYNSVPANNGIVPIDKSNIANASWLIDWNGLFKGDQTLYKRCNVRFHLITNSWAGTGTNFDNFSVPVSCNLPSMYHSSTSTGTTLAIVHPETVRTGGSTHCINFNTLQNAQGVDISIPTGVGQFTFTFNANDTFAVSTITTVLTGYILLLQFELSEERE